jgi:ZIP family zinc transporter
MIPAVLILNNKNRKNLIPYYGFSSGLMITSSFLFLVPTTMNTSITIGSLSIAIGILLGFSIHTGGHIITHKSNLLESNLISITVHSLMGGIIIGFIYKTQPSISIVLGLSIISHKAPAGYNIANKIKQNNNDITNLFYPSIIFGIGAIITRSFEIGLPVTVKAIIIGISTGLFIHIGMDFLPRCETKQETTEYLEKDQKEHILLDKYRKQATVSTLLGSLLIIMIYFIVL